MSLVLSLWIAQSAATLPQTAVVQEPSTVEATECCGDKCSCETGGEGARCCQKPGDKGENGCCGDKECCGAKKAHACCTGHDHKGKPGSAAQKCCADCAHCKHGAHNRG